MDRLRERVETRLGGLPRARQRLAPTPLRLAPPAWVDDDGFDIRRHVRLASEPVTDRDALIGFVGKVMAERLDHERPLWCVDVVGPDDVGRTALVIRIHHCLADGVTALRMLSELLWDDEGGTSPDRHDRGRPAPAPARTRMVASGVASRLRGAGGALAGGARSVASPRRWRQAGREVAALPGTLRRELWPLGADTAFDRRIGGDREVAFTACELEDLKRIEHAAGNGRDGQRRRPGRRRRRDPRAGSATHHEPSEVDARAGPGEHAPPRRGRRRRSATATRSCSATFRSPSPTPAGAWRRSTPRPAAARSTTTRTSSTPSSTASRTSGPLYRCASGVASGPREFALSVSNVPGPREPVRLLGATVTELYSVAEPADRHALRASVVSLAGRMGFGFCTDPGAVPGVAGLADGLDASLEELSALC